MNSHIKQKIGAILNSSMTESDICYLVVLIRKLIECLPNRFRKRFAILEFYCNWAVHVQIDRSLQALKLLSKGNSVIFRLRKVPNNNLIINEITKIISFLILKQEIKKFFRAFGLDDNLTENKAHWVNFVKCFIEIILGIPLTIPKDKDRKEFIPHLERIYSKPLKVGVWIIAMALVKLDQGFFEGDGKSRSGILFLCLIFYLSDTTRIIIPLSDNFAFDKI